MPDTWEGFLKPEFAGRKFVLDIRPKDISALVPVWGLEKTLDFARKLAAQKPIWARGNTRVLTAMLAGEQTMLLGPDFDSVIRVMDKDKTDSIAYKLVEPVPVRLNEAQGILSKAENPYAALLWLEFVGSPEGQKILDESGPYEASVFIPGTFQDVPCAGKSNQSSIGGITTRFRSMKKKSSKPTASRERSDTRRARATRLNNAMNTVR